MNKMTIETKKKWNYLVTKFDLDFIKNQMTLDDYIIGKGSESKSFCYLVEVGLNELGGIRGATSFKFGIYYGKTGSDKENKYRFQKSFGATLEEAFLNLKEELYSLIFRTQQLTSFIDIESKIHGMFKYKIMYLYNPKIMLPSFVEGDLKYFAERLGLEPKNSFEALQNQLLVFKSENYNDLSNHEWAVNLYKNFGRPVSSKIMAFNQQFDRELNDKIRKEHINVDAKEYVDNMVQKTKPKVFNGDIRIFPRDPKMAQIALERANYSCENNPNHECFIRKKDLTPYTEVHHLVPLCFQDEFEVNLDVPANIVSLCSNCHNEIHYGKDADKIIIKLYKERENLLKKVGIDMSLNELLAKYKCIRDKE